MSILPHCNIVVSYTNGFGQRWVKVRRGAKPLAELPCVAGRIVNRHGWIPGHGHVLKSIAWPAA
eukprot:707195-Amphidinium_carterae.1